ncbi:MAG: succinate dehydrogenase cytochrome b subunit [Propionibacterium sp.]|nr:succinate dehydrogenase cytochrome b subunit [Propionibacterium sp.]
MATATITPKKQGGRSTVVAKAVMAVTGLIMIGFLLIHMYGNLKIFSGAEAFNSYSAWLREAFYPILPHKGLLWILRVVLVVSVLLHMWSAFTLWSRDNKATGGGRRYASSRASKGLQRSFASRTLRWGGVIIALFVIFHILHFTAYIIRPGGMPTDTPYDRVMIGYSPENWWITLIYVVALIMLLFHLRHGIWSALTTLGANTSVKARKTMDVIAWVVSIVIIGGFLLTPIAVLTGIVS